VDKGLTVDILCQGLSMIFDRFSHRLLFIKLVRYGLDMWVIKWAENWLDCLTQRVGGKSS